jgi:dTMP kinase
MLCDANNLRFTKPAGFIVLEGVNGAGKSTLQNSIAEYIEQAGRACLKTFEPGATELGKALRRLLLERPHESKTPLTEVFLFAADRAEHVAGRIRPALQAGQLVISDRYFYSTLAFQGYGRGLDVEMLERINRIAIDGTTPDLVILMDLDPEEGLRRTRSRQDASAGIDKFEDEELAFHRRLRDGFLRCAKGLPESFLVVDAAQSQAEIFRRIRPALDSLLTALGATK